MNCEKKILLNRVWKSGAWNRERFGSWKIDSQEASDEVTPPTPRNVKAHTTLILADCNTTIPSTAAEVQPQTKLASKQRNVDIENPPNAAKQRVLLLSPTSSYWARPNHLSRRSHVPTKRIRTRMANEAWEYVRTENPTAALTFSSRKILDRATTD